MIKKYDEFNEGLGNSIRKILNKDEKTALGILDIMTNDLTVEFTRNVGNASYKFNIDGFDIKSEKRIGVGRGANIFDDYYLIVDDTELDCSRNICKKIFNKSKFIYEKKDERDERDRYTKKDARIHFANEGLGHSIRKLFNSDEDTALGILNSINKLLSKLDVTRPQNDKYECVIDDFRIKVIDDSDGYDIPSSHYKTFVDDVILGCSSNISKKIYKKLEEAYNREEIEKINFTKKDAKIHFNPNKK